MIVSKLMVVFLLLSVVPCLLAEILTEVKTYKGSPAVYIIWFLSVLGCIVTWGLILWKVLLWLGVGNCAT